MSRVLTAEPDTDLEERDFGEERLLAWRREQLYKQGFTWEQIGELPLHRADIAHATDDLLRRGASHPFVVNELRED